MTPNRRELLKLLGAGTAALAVGCGEHGAAATAVLDPDEDSAVVAIWSRLPAREAIVTVRQAGQVVRQSRVALGSDHAMLEVTGLTPATSYEVTVAMGGWTVGRHALRTAPAVDDSGPVRIAVIADFDPNPDFVSGMLDALVAAEPEHIISIGDFPYTDNGPPAQTVAQYRERHAALRAHPPLRPVLESCGLSAIYDDHEFVNDWDAAVAAAEPARHIAALSVWDEFYPLRDRPPVRYRSWRWGANLECFLLDTRHYRSANNAPDNNDKTMLGAFQHRWLIDGLTNSTAPFKLVLTGVPLDFGNGDDHWASFTTARNALFAGIIGIPGVVFMSADQHWFAAHRHAFGIREFQIGPLARGLGTPERDAPGVLFRSVRYNAGLVEVDGDQLTISGLGEDGEVFHRESFTAAQLTPSRTTLG